MRGRLAGSDKLTNVQKDEIIDLAEQQYHDRVGFRTLQHQENISFINNLAGQTGLSKEERKSMVQAHRQKQKQENKGFMENQMAKGKSLRQIIKSDLRNYSE